MVAYIIQVNLLKQYTNKHCLTAAGLLKKYAETGGTDTMHQLRVTLKKITAVTNCLSENKNDSKTIHQLKKKIRTIFKKAGQIRDAELTTVWLKKNRFHLLYNEATAFFEMDTKRKAFMQKSSFDAKKLQLVCKGVKKYTGHKRDFAGYVLQLKQNLFITNNLLLQSNWHEIRKNIKQILYAVNWLPANEQLKVLKVAEHKKLEFLQELIGSWHDGEQLKQWLTDRQFFLKDDEKIRHQFNRCWQKLQTQQLADEKPITELLKEAEKKFH